MDARSSVFYVAGASSALAQLVRGQLDALGLSYERAADRTLGMISRATLHRLADGKHRGGLKPTTLAGLALALEVDESLIRSLLPERVDFIRPFVLPPRASQLTAHQRRLVLDYIDRLLVKGSAEHGG
jgi:hypothetical protein